MTRYLAAAIATLVIHGSADAGVLGDLVDRADEAAIKTLRADPGDLATRCALGVVYARRNDLSRAQLFLHGCGDRELPADISATVARTRHEVSRRLRDSELSQVAITSNPDGLTAEITALPGETVTTPMTVWVKAGTYDVRVRIADGSRWVSSAVTVAARSRAMTLIETQPRHAATTKVGGTVDFSDENAAETQQSGPPPDVKRESLVPDRYRRRSAAVAPDDALVDPLALHSAPIRVRPLQIGARIGGGVFDDSAGEARVGPIVAGVIRNQVGAPLFASGRLEWSRRGSRSVDVIGIGLGGEYNLTPHLAVVAQLRGDLRISDDTMSSRVGATAIAGVDVHIPVTPISVGVRFDQSLHPVVGARDRAFVIELGVDWR